MIKLNISLRCILVAAAAVMVLCPVLHAGVVYTGDSNGQIHGRSEYDLATDQPSNNLNFGAGVPISRILAVQSDLVIGLGTGGNNVQVRHTNDLANVATEMATGFPISALGYRSFDDCILAGDTGITSGGNGTFVRTRANLAVRPATYVGNYGLTDGGNWGMGITAYESFSDNGDFVVGTAGTGMVSVRQANSIWDYPTYMVPGHGYVYFGDPIVGIGIIDDTKYVVGTRAGVLSVRPRNDAQASIGAAANFALEMTAFLMLPDGRVVVGFANGDVHIRNTANLTSSSSTSANFGASVGALALTSDGNIAVGAGNLVFVRRSTDLTSRPAGYIGTDGIDFGATVRSLASVASGTTSGNWRDASNRSVLRNDAIEARFQSGILYQLTDRVTGKSLVSVDPATLPGSQLIFGSSSFSLDASTVSLTSTSSTVSSTFTSSGTTWLLNWTIEPGNGDLVLQTSASTPSAIEEFRAIFFDCNISDYGFVWVDGYGSGQKERAPWYGVKLGDPQTGGSPMAFIQPLAVLFEGDNSGWFVEGREPNIGPAVVMIGGKGQSANVGMCRRFPATTQAPQLYEVHFRTYSGQWQNAVDPYLDWMRNTVGFVPIEQKSPAWVRGIKNQAYVTVGNYSAIDALAAKVDPTKTFVGRQAEYRNYAFDIGYPDYTVTSGARAWFTYVRQLGFHVGAHFNAYCIDKTLFPNLIQQFKPGLQQVGTDGSGNPIYDGFGDRMVYCSPAYKPWRDFLISQMADAVNSGVDVIYLDQTMSPAGKFLVNGVTGVQGVMLLEQEIMQAYPNVTVSTEQFNPMASRHAGFALSQMPNGHPLSGYIFSHFIHVVPEGIMYSPLDVETMDAFDTWGFMLPGTDTSREASWMEIVQAVQSYDLKPDSRLARREPDSYTSHYTGGIVPVMNFTIPPEGVKLFGFQGANGVTAYFERQQTQRGLVIYEPGQDPRWVGTRHFNITTWAGPGGLKDWLLYNGSTLVGLEPGQTYCFDPTVTMPSDRFHVTSVPSDFALYSDSSRRIYSQEISYNNDNYFKITFSGHGQMGLYVPDAFDAYLNAQKVNVNRETKTAAVTVSADSSNPSVLRVFRRSERDVVGKTVYLPGENPLKFLEATWADTSDGIYSSISGRAMFFGKLPQVGNVRLRGSYQIDPTSTTDFTGGDGVVKINGNEVLRVHPTSQSDHTIYPYDADISTYAGQYVMMELLCDGQLHGYAFTHWISPEITADSPVVGLVPIGASSANGWNSSGAVSVRASSQHYSMVAQYSVDGSGISTDGNLHGNTGLFISDQLAVSKSNPRGGTVPGGHWIEFTFDKVYPLGQMWIWNFNAKSSSSNWTVQGFKTVTIQSSLTGSANPTDWTALFTGDIPSAYSVFPDYRTLPNMRLPLNGINARYVVITTADAPDQNWSNGLVSDAGLGEVRFYSMPAQTSIRGAKLANAGDAVNLTGAVVTAAFRDGAGPVSFAIEDSDRSVGIRIISNTPVSGGDSVNITGQVATVNGERVISASQVTVNSSNNTAPAPLGMNNISTGGGAYFGQDAVVNNADATPDVMSVGTNSIGLLTTISGRVTARNNTGDWSGYFYVDDGSGLRDGSGSVGIRCRPSGSGSAPDALPAVDAYVGVTGVMGIDRINSANVRFFWTSEVVPFD